MIDSILNALLGGALIGLAASWLLLVQGRIAGISGILGAVVESPSDAGGWRWIFLAGLLTGGVLLTVTYSEAIVAPRGRSLYAVAAAGLLVGFGTRLGNGCTSGHGVCGLSRFSPRSLAATLTFMATGFATATLIGWLGGGQ